MSFKKLELNFFRNYKKVNLEFTRDSILIFGDNGQGKTNLLESIYYLSTGKSHRTSDQDEMINWESDFAVLRAQVNGHLVEVEIRRNNGLKVKVDGVITRNRTEFTGIVPAVIFTPEDLKIIKENPSHRRNFLDDILERIYPDFQGIRLKYQKILNQRNSLIKSLSPVSAVQENFSASTLDSWDENLVKYGTEIMLMRLDLVREISNVYPGIIKEFFPLAQTRLFYIYSWQRKSLEDTPNNQDNDVMENHDSPPAAITGDPEKIKKLFLQKLKESFKKELGFKTTIIGPHRDDFAIFFNNHDLRSFGSQGQQRVASVTLKLCEINILRDRLQKEPVLLLDDILSELDRTREEVVMKMIRDNYQTFITTSREDLAEYKEVLGNDKIQEFQVKNNNIL